MAAQIAGVFESSLSDKVKTSKILVVGAGGIGCELLKNLVMSGFSDIEIVSFAFMSLFLGIASDKSTTLLVLDHIELERSKDISVIIFHNAITFFSLFGP